MLVGLSRVLSMSGKNTVALLPQRAYTEVRPSNEVIKQCRSLLVFEPRDVDLRV